MPPLPLRLYTDLRYRAGETPQTLVPWLRARESDSAAESPKERIWEAQYQIIEESEHADWWVLPDRWLSYLATERVHRAVAFAREAERAGKLVLVWCGGDPEYLVPFRNAVVVQSGLYKNHARLARYAFELPAFLQDVVAVEREGTWSPLPWQERPQIGFCGQGRGRLRSRLGFHATRTRQQIALRLGRGTVRPSAHGFPPDLRRRALERLDSDGSLETHFIIRSRYQAGGEQSREAARAAFLENVESNLYTLCVRGGGNYSKRFYETLCLGRIPILLDTDSLLPFEELMDWSPFVVRVPLQELPRIGEHVSAFHRTLTPESCAERQRACRQLWTERLSDVGYYRHFPEYVALTGAAATAS